MKDMNQKLEFAQNLFWAQPKFDRPRFHYRDGIYFIRNEDRSVTILQVTFSPETNMVDDESCEWEPRIHFEITVDMGGWCSAIASVGKEGETSEAWKKANELHGCKF